MISFSPGDLIIVKYPETSQLAGKFRPAVVISTESHNGWGLDFVTMPITSQAPPHRAHWLELKNWQINGLLYPSWVKPVVQKIERSELRRHIGRLDEGSMNDLGEFFHAFVHPFGLLPK